MPFLNCCGVLVAVMEPIDHLVLPPNCGAFSKSTTRRPRVAASIAAARPLPPPPITTTSVANSFEASFVSNAADVMVSSFVENKSIFQSC